MSDATGLGPIEVAVLDSFAAVGALTAGPYVKSQRILELLYDRHRIGPRVGYRVICDMARADVSHLRLVDFNGNHGTCDFSPASPRYTEARLTPLGAAAAAAERGELGGLPIGLINGTTHVDGPEPPLDPSRTISALRAAWAGAADADLIGVVGLPVFATGCSVEGDLECFAAGSTATLVLHARIVRLSDDQVVIAQLPPDVANSEVANEIQQLADRARRDHPTAFPIIDVNDRSDMTNGSRIVVRVRERTEIEAAINVLAGLTSTTRTKIVTLPAPLPDLLRRWVTDHAGPDLDSRLTTTSAATSR
jgi:hypothetical protein